MAKEMMSYTKNNILVQASQAMLAQAKGITENSEQVAEQAKHLTTSSENLAGQVQQFQI